MDVTDTYFEGIGCSMAELTRTKTEMPHKRCLSIALLVNDKGYPMRWKVFGGKTKDWHAMGELLEDIGDVSWLANMPMVFDRAMGNQKTVASLKARSDLMFLTAAHVSAIESYTKDVPFTAVTDVELKGTDESYEQDIDRVANAAREAGFEEIHPRLFAVDLGVTIPTCEKEDANKDPTTRRGRGRPALAATHLRQAYDIQAKLAADPTLDRTAAADSLGITTTHLDNQLALLRLAPEVHQRILQWDERFPFGEKYLRSLLCLPPEEQLAALDEKLASHTSAALAANSSGSSNSDESIGLLRFVAYFNPKLFVDIRRRTAQHCEKLQLHAEKFNAELAAAKRSRKRESTYRKFAHEVERLNYGDLFDIELTPITVRSPTGRSIASYQGSITRKEEAWKRRRRYDGFVLLLGHPELPHTAAELVNLYRVKDTVEKDFQTIKSIVKLRPIFSHTDPKVQAHVTLCMLALLLERTLENQLHAAGLEMSAPRCIEELEDCRLNERQPGKGVAYDVTQPTSTQREILAALGLEHLAQEEFLRNRITARSPSPESTPPAPKRQRRAGARRNKVTPPAAGRN
jgi:hypothetical protein